MSDVAVPSDLRRHDVSTSLRTVITLAGSVILVGLSTVLLNHLNFQQALLNSFQLADDAGIRGRMLFIAVVVLCVITLVPSVLLSLGAGALYGVVEGFLLMVFAETLGSMIAFLLARHLINERVCDMLKHRARLRVAMAVILTHDLKLVALFRMTPFFPFELSNYFLGVTHIASGPYVLGTLIGLWPMTLFTVYLGSLAANLLSLDAGGDSWSYWQWGLWIAGLLIAGALVVTVVRHATVILREHHILSD